MPSIKDFVLTHHSLNQLELDHDRVYVQQDDYKPRGLWLSDDSNYGWKEWCTDEHFHLDALKHASHFQFSDEARIKWISSVAEMVYFTSDYRRPIGSTNIMHFIDWPKVAEKYDGILITPYQWSQRMDVMWYYSWDCASACVWNTDVLVLVDQEVHSGTA